MGVHEFILERGAYPSPLLYKGFPKSCCTSVNNILVHGIPDELSTVRSVLSFLGQKHARRWSEAEQPGRAAGHCRTATS